MKTQAIDPQKADLIVKDALGELHIPARRAFCAVR